MVTVILIWNPYLFSFKGKKIVYPVRISLTGGSHTVMAEMLCSLGEEQQLSSHDLGNARVCEAGTASIRALDMTCLFLLLLPLVCVESAAGCVVRPSFWWPVKYLVMCVRSHSVFIPTMGSPDRHRPRKQKGSWEQSFENHWTRVINAGHVRVLVTGDLFSQTLILIIGALTEHYLLSL